MSRFLLILPIILIIGVSLFAIYTLVHGANQEPSPPSEKIREFLPDNEFWWTLFKSDPGDTRFTDSWAPMKPKIEFKVNCSANLGGMMGYPLLYYGVVVVGGSSVISAYSVEDGHMLWSKNIFDMFKASIGAYGIGDKVYIATLGRYDEHGNNIPALLIALDLLNGEVAWTVEIDGNLSHITSNLIVYYDKIIFGSIWSDQKVYCYSASGKLLWSTVLEEIGNIRGIAVGENNVYVTGENGYFIVALSLFDGSIVWRYRHDNLVGTPIYHNGLLYIIDSSGNLLGLTGKDGNLKLMSNLGGVTEVDTNSYMAISDKGYIYLVSRRDGGTIYKLNSEGEILASYRPNDVGEALGNPAVGNRVILVPAYGKNYVKLYFLWDDLVKLYDLRIGVEEAFLPSISISNASIYIVYPIDRSRQILIKLSDKETPSIVNVSGPDTLYVGEEAKINATIFDNGSGIYKAVLIYQIDDGEIKFIDMDILRRYIREPSGGYGFKEELYGAAIPGQDNGVTVKYRVLAIDNVGNYILSDTFSYRVVGQPSGAIGDVNLYVVLLVVMGLGAALYIFKVRKWRYSSPFIIFDCLVL